MHGLYKYIVFLIVLSYKIGMLHIIARNVPSDIRNILYIILRLNIKIK